MPWSPSENETVFLAHWTGRHEWHTRVGELDPVDLGTDDLSAAGAALQRQALDDTTTAFIVHAHAVKTTRAATEEATATGSPRPLQAVARFLGERDSLTDRARHRRWSDLTSPGHLADLTRTRDEVKFG